MSWSNDRTDFDRNIAVIIGINDYRNGIHPLSTPVNDARELADLFKNEYKYQEVICLFPPYKEATLENINEVLKETLLNQIRPTESDRLLFYFAGHGIARNSEDGPAGYLIPQDAHLGKIETFLPMRDLNLALSQLDCHHLLVILDCCFAGNFRWSGTRNVIAVPETIHREHYDRFIRCSAWQAITSSAHNQEALDFFSDLRRETTKNSAHSPFALALIEGLKDNKADLTKDGVITAPELYLYLRDSLIDKDGVTELQTPGLWPLPKHDRGEFIFTKSGFEREQLKPAPPLNEDNNPYRGLQPFDEKHARFFFGRQTLVEELYGRISQFKHSSIKLIAVVGISGSGKSSLVKAGLIPYLRKEHEEEWYILEPMRPGESPLTSLARTIMVIANKTLAVQLEQINFLNAALQENSNQFKKISTFWNDTTLDKKLLLIIDCFDDLKMVCRNSDEELRLEKFKNTVQVYLRNLSASLEKESRTLINIITTWIQENPQLKLLLIIDQFEELITMSSKINTIISGTKPDLNNQKPQRWQATIFRRQSKFKNNERAEQKNEVQQEWQQFLALLINTLKHCPQFYIILTLRSDIEPWFVESKFKYDWDIARFLMRPMRADELREVIEKPASEMALYFEPTNSVDRLISEVGEMPGALPLLSFTLSEFYLKLYQAWVKDAKTDRALTVDDQFYQQGGIAGSLTHRANNIYESLPDDAHRDTMRRVMLRMVEIQAGEMVRRQVLLSEINYIDNLENQRVKEVINCLVNARLVVQGKSQEAGEGYVEPSHDFLVKGWVKLQQWQEQVHKNVSIEIQRRLTQAANDFYYNINRQPDLHTLQQKVSHHSNSIESKFLWNNDPRLALFEAMLPITLLKEYQNQENLFNSLIQKIGKIVYRTLQTQPGIVEEPNQLNQRELDFVLKSINLRNKTLGRFVGSIILTTTILIAVTIFALIGQKNALVNQIKANHQASEAALLSNQQLEALTNAVRAVKTLNYHPILQIFRPSVQIERQSITMLYRAIEQTNEFNRFEGHQGDIESVNFSSNGEFIVTASKDKTAMVWNFKGQLIAELKGHQDIVKIAEFSPNSQYILTISFDETARVWNLQGQLIAELKGHQGEVSSAEFSPNGRYIVTASEDKTARVWNLQGQLIAELKGHQGKVSSAEFSPNGQYIVTASEDKTARIWNFQGQLIAELKGHQGEVSSAKFSP
ncbi:nSTAND1 domain-containing NTPase, partial [Nostoc sp. UIC 10890]